MKGIMFSDKYGLESAVLNGTNTRTWRADKQPRYEVGEVVAIKQCYCRVVVENKKFLYSKVDMNTLVNEIMLSVGWRNKMFVKNELMPNKIRILSIKKCRLQDLTDNYETARRAFANLINKLNCKCYWDSNPEGYAYEFELVK